MTNDCAMLDDPEFAYQQIAKKFDLTRQRIAQLASELGIKGRKRQHQRTLGHGPHIIKKFEEYPPGVRAAIKKIRRSGIQVARYDSLQPVHRLAYFILLTNDHFR
jgi:hypothetical protein